MKPPHERTDRSRSRRKSVFEKSPAAVRNQFSDRTVIIIIVVIVCAVRRGIMTPRRSCYRPRGARCVRCTARIIADVRDDGPSAFCAFSFLTIIAISHTAVVVRTSEPEHVVLRFFPRRYSIVFSISMFYGCSDGQNLQSSHWTHEQNRIHRRRDNLTRSLHVSMRDRSDREEEHADVVSEQIIGRRSDVRSRATRPHLRV